MTVATAQICRHCKRGKVNRPRGLCWGCYYTPAVNALYPSTSKYGRRGVGNVNGNAPLPDEPTDAAPGSEEKIAILGQRAANRQALFHPHDRRVRAERPANDRPHWLGRALRRLNYLPRLPEE